MKSWSGIYKKIDYANGQWNPEVLEYVFSQAPEVKGLPVNENGKVTVYRGNGTLSVPPEEAFSWSTNRINALWFANHSGTGQAVYGRRSGAGKSGRLFRRVPE